MSMRVLHFVPSLESINGSASRRYKLAMFETMARSVDVCVLTFETGDVPLDGVLTYSNSGTDFFPRRIHNFLTDKLSSFNPDIVHIHGCWNMQAYKLFGECVIRKIPTVISLDRQLEEWHVRRNYLFCKLPKMLGFQRYVLSHAGALHFVNRQEQDSFYRFGWHPCIKAKHPLNDRGVMIEAFNLIGDMSAKDMSEKMLALYQKVIDSVPFDRMDDNELHVEDLLVLAGAVGGDAKIHVSQEYVALIKKLDCKAWRRIFLHSSDEGILDYIRVGIKVMNVPVHDVNVSGIDRFSSNMDVVGKNYYGYKSTYLKSDASLPDFERELCMSVVSMLDKINDASVHTSDFVKFGQMLRSNEYDEDLVCNKLKTMKALDSASRLLPIMKERYALGEGFMFADPLDDKGTMKMRKKLFKSRIQ